MKLVDRETMLQFPAGTLISKYEPAIINETVIKDESIFHPSGGTDFYTQCIFDGAVECNTVDDTGQAELDHESIYRDGMFEDNELYLIWEPAGIQATIDRLQAVMATVAPYTDRLQSCGSGDCRLFELKE